MIRVSDRSGIEAHNAISVLHRGGRGDSKSDIWRERHCKERRRKERWEEPRGGSKRAASKAIDFWRRELPG